MNKARIGQVLGGVVIVAALSLGAIGGASLLHIGATATPTAAIAAANEPAAVTLPDPRGDQHDTLVAVAAAQKHAEAVAAAKAKAHAKAKAKRAAALAAAQDGSSSGPTQCPAGTTANAVDSSGNESNCQALNSSGQPCVAYDDANHCTAYYKP